MASEGEMDYVLHTVIEQVLHTAEKLHIPMDPLRWSAEETHRWLTYQCDQLGLNLNFVQLFHIPGAQLCSLYEQDFVANQAIDIYWALQVWRNCLSFSVPSGSSASNTSIPADSNTLNLSSSFSTCSDSAYSDSACSDSACSARSSCVGSPTPSCYNTPSTLQVRFGRDSTDTPFVLSPLSDQSGVYSPASAGSYCSSPTPSFATSSDACSAYSACPSTMYGQEDSLGYAPSNCSHADYSNGTVAVPCNLMRSEHLGNTYECLGTSYNNLNQGPCTVPPSNWSSCSLNPVPPSTEHDSSTTSLVNLLQAPTLSDITTVPEFQSPHISEECDDNMEVATATKPGGQAHIQLWQFLKELLGQPQLYEHAIRWVNRSEGEFRIVNSVLVARLWGKRKNRPKMNYDKLSRSIRQYYKKNIMVKTLRSQRLVYKFVGEYMK